MEKNRYYYKTKDNKILYNLKERDDNLLNDGFVEITKDEFLEITEPKLEQE